MRTSIPLSLVASIALAACAAACSSPSPPQDQVSVSEIESPPTGLDAGLSGAAIALPVGLVVLIAVDATTVDAGAIAVVVDDPTRVSVLPMVTPGDFALIGVAPGVANLSISVGGQVVSSFSVDGTPVSTLPIDVTPAPQVPAIDASDDLFVGDTLGSPRPVAN
jgi:hypothetical protein